MGFDDIDTPKWRIDGFDHLAAFVKQGTVLILERVDAIGPYLVDFDQTETGTPEDERVLTDTVEGILKTIEYVYHFDAETVDASEQLVLRYKPLVSSLWIS